MTTATLEISSDYVAEIRNDQELFEAVKLAEIYFAELVQELKLYPARRDLNWCTQTVPKRPYLVIVHEQEDGYLIRNAQADFTRNQLLDRVARDSKLIDIVQSLLRQRFTQIDSRIDSLFHEMTESDKSDLE